MKSTRSGWNLRHWINRLFVSESYTKANRVFSRGQSQKSGFIRVYVELCGGTDAGGRLNRMEWKSMYFNLQSA